MPGVSLDGIAALECAVDSRGIRTICWSPAAQRHPRACHERSKAGAVGKAAEFEHGPGSLDQGPWCAQICGVALSSMIIYVPRLLQM